MSGNSKVVHLNQARGSEGNTLQPQLPLPLLKLRDEMGEQLRTLVRQMLDNTDDALFELADRAASNTEQAVYFDAMREVRLKRKRLEMGFMQGYTRAFLDLSGETARRQRATEFSVDSLSLIQNDELEERVAVENMVNKVKNRLATDLQHLTIRVDSLMGNIRVTDEHNPLGPQVLCDAFVAACKELDSDIRAKLIIWKLFDKFVLSHLLDVYEKANKMLIELGVMPDLKVVRRQQSSRSPASRPAPATFDGATGQVVSDSGNPEVFGFLQELMAEQRTQDGIPTLTPITGGVGGSGGFGGFGSALTSGGNMPVLSQMDLMSMLSSAQHQMVVPGASVPGVKASGLIDLRTMMQSLLQQGGRSGRVSQIDEDVINLVSMLFEFILDDRQLPPTMKALIARLQIPMLKVAIADKSFFSKGGHPARRLLNELATAAIGWNEKAEGEADPLRTKVEGIVLRLVKDFEDNLQIFEEILADFQRFVQTELRRGQLVEQRTRDAEEGKAKSELARGEVQQALNDLLAGRAVPEVVLKLLRDGWSNVMVLVCLKHGTDSEDWNSALNLAKDLVWSVSPPEDRSARSQLLQMIPVVLKGLREGLSTTSFSPFEMDKLLKELEGIHLKALQRMSARVVPQPVQPETPAREKTLVAGEIGPSRNPLSHGGSSANKTQAEARAGLDRPGPNPPVIIVDECAVDGTSSHECRDVPVAESVVDETEALVVVEEIVLVAAQETPVESFEDAGDEFLARVDALGVGSWVEFHEEAGKKFRAKLAAIIQTSGKYIFVNRTGVKVAEKTRMGLAVELRRGAVSMLDDGLLFDRALEAVIGNLRASKRA